MWNRIFFPCAHVVFLSVLPLLGVSENNLSPAEKKNYSSVWQNSTSQKVDFYSLFFFLHIKLSPLLLVSQRGIANLKIKKQSLSRSHSAYTEVRLGEAQVIRVCLQNIYFFKQVYNFQCLIFLCSGRALWQKYYLQKLLIISITCHLRDNMLLFLDYLFPYRKLSKKYTKDQYIAKGRFLYCKPNFFIQSLSEHFANKS